MKLYSTLLFLSFIPLLLVSQGIPPREETRLDEVYEMYNLSGENVVIVIIDRGIDYRHPDFINEDGSTRVAYIFDMIDPTGANDPNNPYGVGTIFNASQINEALTNNDPPLSTDRYGHGTATTGIACGNGRGTADLAFQGVAPGATIIAIEITHDPFPPFNGQQGQNSFWDSSYIPIALEFAKDKIDELGLPSVTLMNIGSIGGPTDGTSLICHEIDDFVEAGYPFVCGVGDDGGADNHASGSIAQDGTIEIDLDKAEGGNLRFDLWYCENDRFNVSIERPNGVIEGPFPAPAGPADAVDQFLDGIYIGHRGADVEFYGSSSNKREILIDFSGSVGVYKVILEGAQITDGDFHATLNPSRYNNNNKFLSYQTEGYSINDFASAELLISPGDYVVQNDWFDINGIFRDIVDEGESGERWVGSSSGPTQDERLGIDFVTPGEVCHAAYGADSYYSSFEFNTLQNSNGFYGIQNAVSAAAPLTTGIIALMLEASPNLSPAELKSILQVSCTQDEFTGNVPNSNWGYGKLNALLAIENVVSVNELGINSVSLYPNPTTGEIKVNLGEYSATVEVQINNIVGQRLMSKKFSGTKILDFNIPGPKGIYFITIVPEDGASKTLKVIKNES